MDTPKKNHLENGRENISFQDERSRNTIIMFNAVIVLIVVIIAMTAQLVRLNQEGKKSQAEKAEQAAAMQGDSRSKKEAEAAEIIVATSKPEKESGNTIEHIRKDLDQDRPMVALTFDDGPYDKVTDRLVKIFAKNDSRATFFVVANRLTKYAESMRKAYEHGNQIATHTFDHGNLSKMSKKGILSEMNRANETMKKVTGEDVSMLRPPYGSVSQNMRKYVKMPMICWNVDSEDWKSRNKKSILKRCSVLHDGDIVLCHDLYPATADAMAVLLPKMRKKGIQFVTVEELFYYRGIDSRAGKVYFNGLSGK